MISALIFSLPSILILTIVGEALKESRLSVMVQVLCMFLCGILCAVLSVLMVAGSMYLFGCPSSNM